MITWALLGYNLFLKIILPIIILLKQQSPSPLSSELHLFLPVTFGGLYCVDHEHGNGHGAYATWNWGND